MSDLNRVTEEFQLVEENCVVYLGGEPAPAESEIPQLRCATTNPQTIIPAVLAAGWVLTS
jgi:hypothetical protein